MPSRSTLLVMLTAITLVFTTSHAIASKKPLTFEDLMKFHQVESVTTSHDGSLVAYVLQPDRGDSIGMMKTSRGKEIVRVPQGASPVFAPNGEWVAFEVQPSFGDKLAAASEQNKDKKIKLSSGLAVFDKNGGLMLTADNVKTYAFSGDGQWLAYHFEEDIKEETEQTSTEEKEEVENTAKTEESNENEELSDSKAPSKQAVKSGTSLVLRRMADGLERQFEYVHQYSFDNRGQWLALATSTGDAADKNQLLLVDLLNDDTQDNDLLALANQAQSDSPNEERYATQLTWTPRYSPSNVNSLAFLSTFLNNESEPTDGNVYVWNNEFQLTPLVDVNQAPEGFHLPVMDNPLSWSKSGQRLFFGFGEKKGSDGDASDDNALDKEIASDASDNDNAGIFDINTILQNKTLVRWHWNDDRIATQRKAEEKEEAKRRYLASVKVDDPSAMILLADKMVREVSLGDSESAVLGYADTPYLKRMTWDWFIDDLYHISLESGERTLIAKALYHANSAALSPNGQFIAWYEDEHWHLWNKTTGEKHNLTSQLAAPFSNEDHDYPLPAGGYGSAQWLSDSQGVIIADKFDLWRFPVDGGEPIRLTINGREQSTQYRIVDIDSEQLAVSNGNILVRGYSARDKYDGFYAFNTEQAESKELEVTGNHRFTFITKAESSDALVFTRENYNEFPDLWSAELDLVDVELRRAKLKRQRKITDANPQIEEFAWGDAELVRYRDADGELTDGVLIKPGNYEEGKQYPVLVYFYRFFSQRLHQFNEPVVNHRPSFPLYASNGYAVFLPDVRFEIGRPGFATTKSLVPGVKKLIDMGIADPDAIGLHGHSWSGYSSAFVVTQTDIFKALVTGAPVSNMTSAYSGIRYGSGLARQFQYEQSQSRIGGSLWEYPERYIENSPVFFANRINTPMLIQFGDEDEAVPWTQGIELYLAMRRLEKPAVFLQYEGEPHHLKQYANKLDYSIKMKEFFDHFLKGEQAPKWWSEQTTH